MAINKTDLAFKKLINRQFTTPNRAFYQEAGTNTLEIDLNSIYAANIPSSRNQASASGLIRVMSCVLTKDYSGTVSTSSFYVISGSGYTVDANNYNSDFSNRGANFFSLSSSYVQRNFLSEKYGNEYTVDVRDNTGTQISTDSAINWYFDYKSGVLHVADPSSGTLPYSLTASQYIGPTLDQIIPLNYSSGSSIGKVEMYGAKGDGVTDDFVAFKHALVSHSVVELEAKTYAVRGYIGVPSYRSIIGKGKDKTTVKLMNNSPYGFGNQVYVFQNTVLQDTVYWTGSAVGTTTGTGSVLLDYRDVSVRDESPASPFFRQSQSQAWAGMGYWSYDTSIDRIGCRKDILIKDLTVDCNINNQAKHVSFNHPDNPYSASKVAGGGYYIPEYHWKIRPTVHAIGLDGENIVIENVVVRNYGYGVAYAASGPLNYNDSTTLPIYTENFPILLTSGLDQSFTSSNTNDLGSDVVGNSRARGNYAIRCEVLEPGNTDLLNPFSNASAIYVNNQSINNTTGQSTFPTEGGIFDCIVDPGIKLLPPTASRWLDSYLDEYVSSSLNQGSASLAIHLLKSYPTSPTGSNGDYALTNNSPAGASIGYLKKISGSWFPVISKYSNHEHYVQGISGFRSHNCSVKNVNVAFYLDSWRNNCFIENCQAVDVDSAFRTVVSDISLTSSFKNVVVKDSYFKLNEHPRAYTVGHSSIFYGVDRATGYGSDTRHIDNLTIEDNIFELPISSSQYAYNGTYTARTYPRYVGIWFASEMSPSGSYKNIHRHVSIKNNKFLNWNPLTVPTNGSGELYGYNIPIYFNYNYNNIEVDSGDSASGPFPLSVNKFKTQILPRFSIEGNTYCDSIYPSTSSLVPIIYSMYGDTGTTYWYPVNQTSNVATLKATSGSISSLSATGSLFGSASYSLTSSYAMNSNNNSSQGNVYWESGSSIISLDGTGSLFDENGNPISSEAISTNIYYTGSVSIGYASSSAMHTLNVGPSTIGQYALRVDGAVSCSFMVTPSSGSSIVALTGSTFYSQSKLFVFTGNGNAGGLVGWQSASLGG